ncbi:ubiquitin carboxyl-terminal hydrolase 17-like [Magnolia sinica]|uniref:ubiquitin carboxyl-terminal hydrolase 17-like n=1 Tax=Magnolia sinica TaxID=86752 RepID=UPI0026589FD1|nr:ubiquitin carboxyl-terminal hydrolase 17-like [Magnolia sinica]
MPFFYKDLGFSGLVLPFLLLVFPIFALIVRRKWRIAAARKQEIMRLVVLASEEAARAELEAAYDYSSAGPAVPAPAPRQQCAVCYCPTTTRCARCKVVKYCSGKCQIIHWRQGHKEECHPPLTTVQFSGVGDSDSKSILRAEQSDPKDNGLETEGQCPGKPDEDFPEEPSSSKSSCSSKGLCGKDDEVMPLVDGTGSDFSTISSSTGCSQFTTSEEPSLSVSATEASVSSTSSTPRGPISNDTPLDILRTSADAHETNISKSPPSEYSGPVAPVNSIPRSSKLKQNTTSCGTETVDCGSSSTLSSSCDSSDEHTIMEPSTKSPEHLEATRDSSGVQTAGCDDSTRSSFRQGGNAARSDSEALFRFSFNLSGQHVPSVMPSQNSNMKILTSDEAKHSVPGNGDPVYGAAPLKKLPTDLPTRTLPALSSERSSSAVKERSNEQLLKSRRLKSSSFGASADHSSSYSGHSSSSVTSSKSDNVQTVTAKLSETASSVPNGGSGLKTSMLKVVQQFRPSKLSKHYPLGFGSEISRKYNHKMLFPYDMFIKLYNWDKVELRPCGLVNCGNSCYANAVLQCLAFTRPLSAYLLQGLHTKTCPKKEWCFTCEFESLLLKAKEGRSPLSPIAILSQIKSIGSHLGHGREEDAHEFLRYAIDTMQSVCLKEAGVNATDPLAGETTLIQLIFGGYLRSKIRCMKCQGKSEKHERMMDLTVEIHGDIGTLEEALAQFTATEILDGDNKYHCSRCKSYEKAKKKLTVLEAPNILTIALKRFQSGKFGKLNKSVRFQEILNLAPYMSGTSDKSPVYRLYAVVVHLDVMNAAFSGHYVCYVKNIQGKWFKIDDSTVKPAELDRVLSKGAYMLLYARCSPRAPSLIRNAISQEYAKNKRSKCAEAAPSSNGENISRGRCSSSVPYADHPASQRMPHHPYWMAPDGPANTESLGSLDGRFLPVHRIPKTDSSSDNSSLFSCSDEGSCSTESTRDSTSTDEYSEYIFGDSDRLSWNSPMRVLDDSDGSSYSPLGLRRSPLSVSNGHASCSPERGSSIFDFSSSSQDDARYEKRTDGSVDSCEADGVVTRWAQRSRREVRQGEGSPSLLYPDTTKQCRNLTSHFRSSSETDWEWVNGSDAKSGVSLRRYGERTSHAFY